MSRYAIQELLYQINFPWRSYQNIKMWQCKTSVKNRIWKAFQIKKLDNLYLKTFLFFVFLFFLFIYKYALCACSVTQWCPTLCNPMDFVARQAPLSTKFSRKQYWMCGHFLLQGIFPTNGLNIRLLHRLHWLGDFLPLHHLEAHKCAYLGTNNAAKYNGGI